MEGNRQRCPGRKNLQRPLPCGQVQQLALARAFRGTSLGKSAPTGSGQGMRRGRLLGQCRTPNFAGQDGWPSNCSSTYRLARRGWVAHPQIHNPVSPVFATATATAPGTASPTSETGGIVTDVFPLQSDGGCPPPMVKQSGAYHPLHHQGYEVGHHEVPRAESH
jgi:hypothetical protein